jgi:SAM-dependent methyltransferase
MATPPRPPLRLARRVGELDPTDPWGHWDRVGADVRAHIDRALPADWDWHGKRALDFGSGPGKVLTQYGAEAEIAEFWGCDIDQPSIDWAKANLGSRFRPFVVEPEPPMARPDGFFDLIWSASVFTHLAEEWSPWLADLHRVLADGGLLMISVLGAGMWQNVDAGEWQEDRTGMCVVRPGQPWSMGGPVVFHSQWWIREHWGRAFDIVSLDPGTEPTTHGWVVLKKRDVAVDAAELDRLGDDPREAEALRHNLELLYAEDRRLRPRYLGLTARDQMLTARWWWRRARSLI